MKLWYCFMAGQNSLEDLKELLEPVYSFFDGLVVTYHGATEDEEYKYLDSIKGHGKIIVLPYSKRHDHSRNTYLWCGPIEEGDWCIQTDVLERLNPRFVNEIREFIKQVKNHQGNIIYYYSKPLAYEYNESLVYYGSPHESLIRLDGQARPIDITDSFPNEADIRLNVRPLKRKDPNNFITHYLKYYLFPFGSNHCLLGLEKQGNPKELFPIRESRRMSFKRFCKDVLQIPLTVDGIKKYMIDNKDNYTDQFKSFINEEKILNDAYRYFVLNEQDIPDDHNWKNMIKL